MSTSASSRISIVIPPQGIFVDEDRTFGGQALFVDLIPSSCWFTNVRSSIKPKEWEGLRQVLLNRADHQCEICGVKHLPKRPLEAHERWAYHDQLHLQKLTRLLMLCKSCHRTTHFGLAQKMGFGEMALKHLMKVNQWDRQQSIIHIQKAFILWQQRNHYSWQLDITMLTQRDHC
jgi:hypothetical protein